jgi:peptide/nickel transport system permease protein
MSNTSKYSTQNTRTESKRRSRVGDFFSRLFKEKPLGTVGAIVVLILFITGIFANFIAPYGMNETNTRETLLAPSAKHWLGTDNLGRDLLTRIIYGARTSMIVGVTATAIATIISTIIGITCGYIGGKLDLVIQRIVDAWLCFPGLVILILIMSVTGPGLIQVIIVLGVRYGIGMSRVIRGAAITVKQNVYVEAAGAIGCRTTRILWRHILPNIMAPVIVLFTTRMPVIILAEASLSFLGFGIPPPTPSWGGMLSGLGRSYMFLAPWMAIWPGLALAIVVYGINMFGDAMRDLLDPRLRGGVGRYGLKLPVRTVRRELASKIPGGAQTSA